jgi:hypothetical protein
MTIQSKGAAFVIEIEVAKRPLNVDDGHKPEISVDVLVGPAGFEPTTSTV